MLNYHLAIPTAFILLGVAVYLTLRLHFIQFRALPRFFSLITKGLKTQKKDPTLKTINPFHALFTAMSTSLGIGTIVGPSVAIIMGGPGALFWLFMYALCGAVTKFVEVTFAVYFREKTPDGHILGGPMQYLNTISPLIGSWYAYATVLLFTGWSSLQANVLAETLEAESIPTWITGAFLAVLVFVMLRGGAKRVGEFNSKLVPIMAVLYISVGFLILFLNRAFLVPAIMLMFKHSLSPASAAGGFLGASIYAALQSGVYKGAFITESGIGTAAIPHSMADVQNPTDQGVLAMTSVFADTFLCMLSGLLVLTTPFWQTNQVSNILMYKVFQNTLPVIGRPTLLITIIMFVVGTIIGNSFNARQGYATITHYRWLNIYYLFACIAIFLGAITDVPLVWAITEVLLPLVAIPNVICLLYLSIKYKKLLQQ
jgi:alanine or glycine:cation symporter, AGCS family